MSVTVWQNKKSPWPWYRHRSMTIKFTTGQTVEGTASIMTIGQSENKSFCEIHPPNLLDEPHLIAELRMDGVVYRPKPYEPLSKRLVGEPIGSVPAESTAKTPISEQALKALRAAPDGLTAREVGEKLSISRQWVFTVLGNLLKAEKIEKRGTLYRALNTSQD